MSVAQRILFRSRLLTVGEFVCPPDDPRWHETNAVSEAPHVVFPRTSVVIAQSGDEPVLATRNHVIFYNPGQRFRRFLHDARGDYCVFVEVAPEVLGELVARAEIPFTHAPSDAETYLVQDTVARSLREGLTDELLVEEVLLGVIARSLERGVAFHALRRPRPRARTEHDHASLVEAAKARLAASPQRGGTLAELARALHTSEFHLARVFRERTGFTIHGYRNQLRLRLALDQIHAGAEIATLAHELGFSSHSHFTSAFRATFGVPPSHVRALGRHGVRELRRIVEAPLAARS